MDLRGIRIRLRRTDPIFLAPMRASLRAGAFFAFGTELFPEVRGSCAESLDLGRKKVYNVYNICNLYTHMYMDIIYI